jgi:iron complex transport system substrate-binding protein
MNGLSDRRSRRRRSAWIACGLLLTGAVAGARAPARRAANLTAGCIDHFDAGVDYFPEKAVIEDAVNFQVQYRRSYKIVQVRRGAGRDAERYVLVQCGAPVPALHGDLSGAQVATVPIGSLYSASTTYLSLLVDLQRLDVLTGVSTKKYLIGDQILKRASRSQVREFAVSSVIDTEIVISQRPGLLMTRGETSAELSIIRQAGIPVVANHEWLEPTALARGEWLKYMALFLNEERAAQGLYGEMKARYRDLSAKATAVPDARKPTVMTGGGMRGDFVIAGGRSYAAALIKDAGGRYVWADNPATGSVTVDLEAQLNRAGNADIWVNAGTVQSLTAMIKDDPRYGLFKAYRNGQVWVYERLVTAAGGNDYWSRAVSHPDLVLADLVKIFHPGLVPQHEFQWYLQVPVR